MYRARTDGYPTSHPRLTKNAPPQTRPPPEGFNIRANKMFPPYPRSIPSPLIAFLTLPCATTKGIPVAYSHPSFLPFSL